MSDYSKMTVKQLQSKLKNDHDKLTGDLKGMKKSQLITMINDLESEGTASTAPLSAEVLSPRPEKTLSRPAEDDGTPLLDPGDDEPPLLHPEDDGPPPLHPEDDDGDQPPVDDRDSNLSDLGSALMSPKPEDLLDLGEDDLNDTDPVTPPLMKQRYRDGVDIPSVPPLPASLTLGLHKGEYKTELPQEDLEALTTAFNDLGIDSPASEIEYTQRDNVYDIRNTNLHSQKRTSPLYKLVMSHPSQSEANNFYCSVMLRPKVDFDKYDILASIDESMDSDGSLLCLGILGAKEHYEKSEKIRGSFKFSEESGESVLAASSEFPSKDNGSGELPELSSSTMRKWVSFPSPSEKIMTDTMTKCLDIEPLTKKADGYEPCMLVYIGDNDSSMDTDYVTGSCLMCTFEKDELVFYDKTAYEFDKLKVGDLYKKYGSKFIFSILVYSSQVLPAGPFMLSPEDLTFEDINVQSSSNRPLKRSFMTVLSANKRPKGRSKKSRKPKKSEPKKAKTAKKPKPKARGKKGRGAGKTKKKPSKTILEDGFAAFNRY